MFYVSLQCMDFYYYLNFVNYKGESSTGSWIMSALVMCV